MLEPNDVSMRQGLNRVAGEQQLLHWLAVAPAALERWRAFPVQIDLPDPTICSMEGCETPRRTRGSTCQAHRRDVPREVYRMLVKAQ